MLSSTPCEQNAALQITFFPRNSEKTVQTTGVLKLIHTDVMESMLTKTLGGSTYVVTFIDEYSSYVTIYFMRKRSEVLYKFKLL